MKSYTLLLTAILITFFACKENTTETAQTLKEQSDNPSLTSENNTADPKADQFYDLTENILAELDKGNIDAVKSMIDKLNQLIPQFTTDWNYGNAIHKVNIAKGRLALLNGNLEAAKTHLIAAADIDGSPQLNSFGPNMSLARELLVQSEESTVLEYLEKCRVFWKHGDKKIAKWKTTIENGDIPDFGFNQEI